MLKRLLFCVLLLFSLLSTCHAVDLTMDQLLTIADEALSEADKDLAKQETQIIELEKDLESSSETIAQLEKEPEILNRIILTQEKELDLQEKLLKKQKTETILTKIYNFFQGIVIGMSISLALYYANV